MTSEVKAGLLTVVAIAMLLYAVYFLSGGLVRDRGYEIIVRVANAGGVIVAAQVQMAGIDVGQVAQLRLNRFNQAEIVLRIRSGVSIPTGSRFSLATAGLLGQPFVTITPGPADAPPMAPGTVIAGELPITIEDLFARVTSVATRAEEALKNLNRLIGDPQLAEGLSETVRNAKDATAAIRQAAEHVQRIADNVERTTRTLDRSISSDVPAIAKELRAMSTDLAAAAHDVRSIVHDVAADGRTASQVKETIGAIQRTAQRIEKMANDLSGVINEQEVRSVRGSIAEVQSAVTEARQAVGEARGLITRASTVVDRVGRILPERLDIPDFRTSYRLEYEIYYASRVGHDVAFTLLPGARRQYIFSWRDIGQTGRLGLQVGNRLDDYLTFRWGLIDSQVGVGLDYQPARASLYSVDLYNFNQITLNVYAHYFLQPEYGISFRLTNLFQTPGLGIGYFRRF